MENAARLRGRFEKNGPIASRGIRSESIQMSYRSWELYEYPTLPQTTSHTWSVKTSTQLEKPRYVILAFQSGKRNVLAADPSLYQDLSLRDVKL